MDQVKASAAAIRAILHRDWDPIGCAVPEDEYDSYIWPVLKLLRNGAPRAEVDAYLRRTADETIGCPVPEERLVTAVNKLMALSARD